MNLHEVITPATSSYYKPNIPLAVIEAKDNNCSLSDGLQQALEYGEMH